MKAVYEITLKLTVVHEVDEINEDLKDAHELATDICNMICDEATYCNAVATYDVIESTINVK